MKKYRVPLAFLLLGVLMLVACLLDIYTGKVDFYGLLAMPVGVALGALISMFQIWRKSGDQVADEASKNVDAASENMADASGADKGATSPTPTEEELQLLAYIVMDKGDSARLNDDEQAFFIKVIREAKAKLEGGHRNEFWAMVYVSEKLKEFGSPALNVVAEFYVGKLAPN